MSPIVTGNSYKQESNGNSGMNKVKPVVKMELYPIPSEMINLYARSPKRKPEFIHDSAGRRVRIRISKSGKM